MVINFKNALAVAMAVVLAIGMIAPVHAEEEECVPQEYVPGYSETIEGGTGVFLYEFAHINKDKNGQENRWLPEGWNGKSYSTSWVWTGETREITSVTTIDYPAIEEVVCEDEEEPTCEELNNCLVPEVIELKPAKTAVF